MQYCTNKQTDKQKTRYIVFANRDCASLLTSQRNSSVVQSQWFLLQLKDLSLSILIYTLIVKLCFDILFLKVSSCPKNTHCYHLVWLQTDTLPPDWKVLVMQNLLITALHIPAQVKEVVWQRHFNFATIGPHTVLFITEHQHRHCPVVGTTGCLDIHISHSAVCTADSHVTIHPRTDTHILWEQLMAITKQTPHNQRRVTFTDTQVHIS